MILIPRNPVNQNPLHRHDANDGTAEGGMIMRLTSEGKLAKVTASGQAPFGILFPRVKSNLAGLPQNFEFPGEIGTSDQRLGDPVLVYQDGGTFEADEYDIVGSGVAVGTVLYARINDAANDGKLTDDTSNVADTGDGGTAKPVAIATAALTADDVAAKKALAIKLLI